MSKNEALVLTKPHEIEAFRLLSLKAGLTLEAKGLRFPVHKSAYRIVKREFGLRGSKEKVLALYTKMLTDIGILVSETNESKGQPTRAGLSGRAVEQTKETE